MIVGGELDDKYVILGGLDNKYTIYGLLEGKAVENVTATIDSVSATTLPAGSAATAENTGTNKHATFVLGIPQGAKGDKGVQGPAGTTDYNDLQNKPAIPTKTSELTNDSNFPVDVDYVHTDNNFDDIEKRAIADNATAIGNKVDKVTGKGLSTVDYTNEDKAKVDTIADLVGATATADGSKGYAPKPLIGDQNKFLRGDGTWADLNETRVIKGVSFDAANAAGTRILNAVSDSFTPATETSAGTDTMASFAPYATYETLEKLNSSTGKLEVVAYEGDMLFDQYLTAAKQGSDCSDICDAVMVNFPMGYISRYQDSTSKEVWGVAEKQVSGVIPSPMHVWGGAQHKVAIGKYTGGILNGKAVCLPNVNTYNSQHLNTYSTRFLADLGCYTMNYACMCYLNMLGSIKYAHRNWQTAVGNGIVGFGYDYLPNTCTVTETGVTRITVSNANAAKFAVGQNIQIFSTSIATFEAKILSIIAYDTDNTSIAVDYTTTFDTTSGTTGFRRAPMQTGGSINILNRDGYAGANDGKHAVVNLDLENYYGNVYTQINGFAINKTGTIYVNIDPTKCLVQPTSEENALALGYEATSALGVLTDGYTMTMTYNTGNNQWMLFPATVGGTSVVPYGDYNYWYSREYLRGLLAFGRFCDGACAGPGCARAQYPLLRSNIDVGARPVEYSDM